MLSVDDLCEQAFVTARKNGFHEREINFNRTEDARHILSLLMLVTTEVAEAAEEVRKGVNKAAFTYELADICIRVFDIAAALDCSLESAIIAKMAQNAERPFRHGGKRA